MLRSMIGLLALLVAGTNAARAADDTSVRASVECEFAGNHAFPFSAGRDRCWDTINGKTLVPRTVIACAVQRSDGTLSVSFHFSELPKPECDNGKVASKEQYSRAAPLLGQKERSFFLSHVESK